MPCQRAPDPRIRLGSGTDPSQASPAWIQFPRVAGQPWIHGSKVAQSTLDPWPPHLPPAPERPKLGLVQAPNLGHATNQPLKHTRAPPQPESCKKTTRIPELVIFLKINSTPRKAPGWIQADPSGSKLLRRGSKLRIQAGPPRIRGGGAHQFAVPRGVQKSAWIRYRLPAALTGPQRAYGRRP